MTRAGRWIKLENMTIKSLTPWNSISLQGKGTRIQVLSKFICWFPKGMLHACGCVSWHMKSWMVFVLLLDLTWHWNYSWILLFGGAYSAHFRAPDLSAWNSIGCSIPAIEIAQSSTEMDRTWSKTQSYEDCKVGLWEIRIVIKSRVAAKHEPTINYVCNDKWASAIHKRNPCLNQL
jgi:hypothetical protein